MSKRLKSKTIKEKINQMNESYMRPSQVQSFWGLCNQAIQSFKHFEVPKNKQSQKNRHLELLMKPSWLTCSYKKSLWNRIRLWTSSSCLNRNMFLYKCLKNYSIWSNKPLKLQDIRNFDKPNMFFLFNNDFKSFFPFLCVFVVIVLVVVVIEVVVVVGGGVIQYWLPRVVIHALVSMVVSLFQ